MEPRELMLVGVRFSHALAAVALVGGTAFQQLALRPIYRESADRLELMKARSDVVLRAIVDLCLPIFVLSGGLMTFERLAAGVGTAYVLVLSLKLALSILLCRWALQVRRSGGWEGPAGRYLVGSGIAVVFLAGLLKTLFEAGSRL